MNAAVYLQPGDASHAVLAKLRDATWDVRHVVLRCGFDPRQPDGMLEAAADAVRQAGLGLTLLVGGWWGEGITPDDPTPTWGVDLPRPSPDTAHESRWPMHDPAGAWTQVVADAAATLAVKFSPDAVVLTHARFRHAADLPGLFAGGDAREGHDLDLAATVRDAFDADAPFFGMTTHPNLQRWWASRTDAMTTAVLRVRDAVRSASPDTAFGVNAMNPPLAWLAGQDSSQLTRLLDVVQPLLGWTHWHVRQPVAAWAAWLHRLRPRAPDPYATAARALGFPSLAADDPVALLDDHLRGFVPADPAKIQIVLRGDDDVGVLREQAARVYGRGFAVAFQGHACLAGVAAAG